VPRTVEISTEERTGVEPISTLEQGPYLSCPPGRWVESELYRHRAAGTVARLVLDRPPGTRESPCRRGIR